MAWGAIGGAVVSAVAAPVIGSMFGGGRQSQQGAQQGAAAADPFASQRPQYQQMLSDLMSGKTKFEETAGAQALTQTGMDAQAAQFAARGLSNSGAEKAELTKYATGIAAQDYNAQMSNLMQMSGAGSGATGTAGQIIANQAQGAADATNAFGATVGNAVVGAWGKAGDGGGSIMNGSGPGAAPWSGSQAASGGAAPMTFDVPNTSLTDFGLRF